jgi:hypothetical protein
MFDHFKLGSYCTLIFEADHIGDFQIDINETGLQRFSFINLTYDEINLFSNKY